MKIENLKQKCFCQMKNTKNENLFTLKTWKVLKITFVKIERNKKKIC